MRTVAPRLIVKILWVLMAAGWVGFTGSALATSNAIPFSDNFDTIFYYPNGTPLIDGTNGWYGSSSDIMVTNGCTLPGSTNMAIIPVDCTLSNRFQSAASTNVWLQMDVKSAHYDGTNPPVVITNSTAMFYISSNGYFVVHNGPATNATPTNSASWVTLSSNITGQAASSNADGSWVHINIHQDFAHTNE